MRTALARGLHVPRLLLLVRSYVLVGAKRVPVNVKHTAFLAKPAARAASGDVVGATIIADVPAALAEASAPAPDPDGAPMRMPPAGAAAAAGAKPGAAGAGALAAVEWYDAGVGARELLVRRGGRLRPAPPVLLVSTALGPRPRLLASWTRAAPVRLAERRSEQLGGSRARIRRCPHFASSRHVPTTPLLYRRSDKDAERVGATLKGRGYARASAGSVEASEVAQARPRRVEKEGLEPTTTVVGLQLVSRRSRRCL